MRDIDERNESKKNKKLKKRKIKIGEMQSEKQKNLKREIASDREFQKNTVKRKKGI